MTDIEIANSVKPKKIREIAKKLGLKNKDIIPYGDYKCKINKKSGEKKGKLVLVTAINPTSAGIGKTTVSIGLADGLAKLNKSVCLALREPSLGPVFGIKGGATGGGRSQVIPMEDINLHFTGDFHAITSANNLLCAMIDNHIFQGNTLGIDKVLFHRCMDMNDRALRSVTVGQTKIESPREDSFSITSASEIMAIMCLSDSINDLKRRLGNILVGLNKKGKPIFAKQLKAQDAMAILLKDALKPNLVQTLEGTPAIVHLGPFANIAHGCNSIEATKLSMSLADYTITEAGFGADLGAEKFFDIKCRIGNLKPDAVVLVATIQALKLHGGCNKNNLKEENIELLEKGMGNLLRHIGIIKNTYKLPLVVTLNKYTSDTPKEVELVLNKLKSLNVSYAINDAWTSGGEGAIDLANAVMDACNEENNFQFSYQLDETIEEKIGNIAKKVYGASGVIFTDKAKESIATINNLGMNKFPICIAKTQYSLSDNAKLIGAPENFEIAIRDIEIRSGSEFLVAIAGDIMLMPGLSKTPASMGMKITNSGKISGLF
ncbi:MAG: formate--tetrahydrofolate ligase [Clostridiales bacterium]|nr:formate--tetrahydrofolate ligase [Clostridiales bacterium]